MQWLFLLFLLMVLTAGSASGQSFAEDLAAARSIRLLEATEIDIDALFRDSTSPFDRDHAQLSRESSVITVSYSSGKCNDSESFGVDPDDWDVAEGRVAVVGVAPRENLRLEQLDLGQIRLSRSKLYRGYGDYDIHYNKARGIAVRTHGDYVESVILFPSEKSYPLLCRDDKIRRYYSRSGWKRDPEPKYACILRNDYANVTDLILSPAKDRLFAVKTTATDPENDVLTYNYRVTAGKILGKGADVVWDLSEASPGTYYILGGVDDGCGLCGKTMTKSITIE